MPEPSLEFLLSLQIPFAALPLDVRWRLCSTEYNVSIFMGYAKVRQFAANTDFDPEYCLRGVANAPACFYYLNKS
ncbi:MAG: hypothetical protein ABR556_06695 [Pyrinomonadaceae bacterium]